MFRAKDVVTLDIRWLQNRAAGSSMTALGDRSVGYYTCTSLFEVHGSGMNHLSHLSHCYQHTEYNTLSCGAIFVFSCFR